MSNRFAVLKPQSGLNLTKQATASKAKIVQRDYLLESLKGDWKLVQKKEKKNTKENKNVGEEIVDIPTIPDSLLISSKDYARSKSDEHKVMEARNLRKRNNRLQKKLEKVQAKYEQLKISTGRKQYGTKKNPIIRPEGDTYERLQFIVSQCTGNDQHQISSVLVKVFGYLTALSSAKSMSDFVAITAGVVSQHLTAYHMQLVEVTLNSYMTPQGGIMEFREKISNFKILAATIEEIPCFRVLQQGFMLLAFCGFKPEAKQCSVPVLREIMKMFDRDINVTGMDAIMAFTSISEYVLEVLDIYLRGCPMYDVLLPSTLFSRYSKLQAKYLPFSHGQLLELHHQTDFDYLMEVKQLKIELDRLTADKRLPSHLRVVYSSHLRNVLNIENDIMIKSNEHRMRVAPAALVLYASSNVGKSNVAEHFIRGFGSVTGVPVEPENRWFANPDDKYQSGYTEAKTVIVIDDLSNTKVDKIPANETMVSKLVQWINNVPVITTQAEVSDKGRIQMKSSLIVVTTNIDDLKASAVSNEPYSILRRLHFVHIKIKPEFSKGGLGFELDPSRVQFDENGVEVPMHLGRRFKWAQTQQGNVVKEYIDAEFRSIEIVQAEVAQVLKEHHYSQLNYIQKFKDTTARPRCLQCGGIAGSSWCRCIVKPEMLSYAVQLLDTCFRDCVIYLASRRMICVNRMIEDIIFKSFVALLYVNAKYFVSCGSWRIFGSIFWFIGVICALTITNNILGFTVSVFLFLVFLVLSVLGASRFCREAITHEIRNRAIQGMEPLRLTMYLGSVVASIAMLRTFWSTFRTIRAEGNLTPKTMAEVELRRAQKSDWKKPDIIPLCADVEVATMTSKQLVEVVKRSMVRFDVKNLGTNSGVRGMGIMVRSDVLMIPLHSWNSVKTQVDAQIIVDRRPGQFSTARLQCHVIAWKQVADLDFVCLSLSKRMTVVSFRKFLPHSVFEGTTVADLHVLSASGDFISQEVMYDHQPFVSNGVVELPGSYYTTRVPTQSGDCMGLVISRTKPHCVVGFHSGGNGHGYGCCFSMSQCALEECLDALPGIKPEGVLPGVAVDITKYQCSAEFEHIDNVSPLGEQILEFGEIHERSVVNYLRDSDDVSEPNSVEVFGYDRRWRVAPHSQVFVTKLSPLLEDEGLERKHSKPCFRSDRNHAEYFQIAARSMSSVPFSLEQRIINDYVAEPIIAWSKLHYQNLRPLSLYEALNGIPDNRWIKRLDENTSAGCGLPGQKHQYLDIFYQEDGSKVLHPTAHIISDVKRQMRLLQDGVRVAPIVKTALKDEPTKMSRFADGKNKVRVFAVFPFCNLLVGKMLFAPILSAMYDIPTLVEQGQGCNCTDGDWEQLYNFIFDKSHSQVLEGDFSKFDTRISGQMIRMAGSVLCIFADYLGYSQRDIVAMATYVSDIAQNFWVYNGTIMSLDGWNPSGNYLTIAINGIVNSLLHRIAFFELPSGISRKFRDCVNLITVGDDSLASTNLFDFDMVHLQKVFAAYNMKYTDGLKSPNIIPFIHSTQASLCKRKFRLYDGHVVAPLDVESILKSLHCNMLSSTDEDTVLCQVVSQALRELARHDQEVFEFYASKIRNCCRKLQLQNLIVGFDHDYEQWWLILKSSYFIKPLQPEGDWYVDGPPIHFLDNTTVVTIRYVTPVVYNDQDYVLHHVATFQMGSDNYQVENSLVEIFQDGHLLSSHRVEIHSRT